MYLCGSHAVGTVFQAAVLASGRGPENVVLPVVGECDDGDMADSRTVAIEDVDGALSKLGSEVAEGSVGAGTGMVCFDFPGGIGTSSRVVGDHHVGVLLLCNFGDRDYLDVPGLELRSAGGPARVARLVHRRLRDRRAAVGAAAAPAGAAPAAGAGADRLVRRRGLGRDRPSRSAQPPIRTCRPTGIDPYFAAAYEAAHESVYNCLVAARPARRLDGSMQEGFPVDALRAR